jgi:hypothetical protein
MSSIVGSACLPRSNVDRSAARSLLFSSEDVLPVAWRGRLGCRYAFQMGAAVALLARQFADEEVSS